MCFQNKVAVARQEPETKTGIRTVLETLQREESASSLYLAQQSGINRESVRAAIQRLRKEGFDIPFHPNHRQYVYGTAR
jgi:biotin operon repressor